MRGAKKTNVSAGMLLDMVDESRIVYNWQRIVAQKRRIIPTRHRLVLAAALTLIAVGFVFALYSSSDKGSPQVPLFFELSESAPVITVPPKATAERRIPLSDGSTITLAPGASLEVKDNNPSQFLTLLHKGWVRYNIIPGHTRTWEVDAKLCRIVVLGTQFTVNRTPLSVHIAVHRGTVAVYPPRGDLRLVTLTAGKTYTLHAPRQDSPHRPAPRPRIAKATTGNPAAPVATGQERQKHTKAVEQRPNHAPGPRPSMPRLAGLGATADVNVLLTRADEARMRNKPQRAARLLERILREHPDDPAVSLVAMTLGNIRLDTLHRPRAAALAFRRAATSTWLPSPLREQAYARCVEAFRRAGDLESAQEIGSLYKRRYPSGKWSSWIDRWSKSE